MKKLTIIWFFVLFGTAFSGTHFDTLRVKPTASEDEIKKSYRILAKQYHPDKNKHDPNAQSKFIEITKAYEILSDSKSRLEYIDSLRYPNRQTGNSKMQDWASRNMEADTNFQEFQRFQQFPHGNTFFAYRTPDGRVFYTSRSQNHGQNFQYSYQYSSSDNNNGSFFANVMYALGMIIWVLLQPFLPIIVLVISVSVLYKVFCSAFPKTRTLEPHSNKSRLTAAKPIGDLQASDVKRKGIVIIATTVQAVGLCRRLQRSFLNDPVYFAAAVAPPPPVVEAADREHEISSGRSSGYDAGDDSSTGFPLLAITRGGSKWVGLASMKDITADRHGHNNDHEGGEEEYEEEEEEVDGEDDVEEEEGDDDGDEDEQRLKIVEGWIIQLLNGGLSWRLTSTHPLPIHLPQL